MPIGHSCNSRCNHDWLRISHDDRQIGLQKKLKEHFAGRPLEEITTAARTFPLASRLDLQVAIDEFFSTRQKPTLLGIHAPLGHETPTLAHLFTRGPFPVEFGPLQHDDLDVGDPTPMRSLKNGLWLSKDGELPFALLLSSAVHFGTIVGGVHLELAVPQGVGGSNFSQAFFRELEARVNAGKTYRGKVISLERSDRYSGRGGEVRVHRLHKVLREEVILPERTLSLLDRNVSGVIRARQHVKNSAYRLRKGFFSMGRRVRGRPIRSTILPPNCLNTPPC